MTMGFKEERRQENFEALCLTLRCGMKPSFRASGARAGIQDFQAVLDSCICRNDEMAVFCGKGIGLIPSFQEATLWWWCESYRERFTRR